VQFEKTKPGLEEAGSGIRLSSRGSAPRVRMKEDGMGGIPRTKPGAGEAGSGDPAAEQGLGPTGLDDEGPGMGRLDKTKPSASCFCAGIFHSLRCICL